MTSPAGKSLQSQAVPALSKQKPAGKKEEDLGPPPAARKTPNGQTIVAVGASWTLVPNQKLLPFSESKEREVVRSLPRIVPGFVAPDSLGRRL